jgi:hypothetical protein
MKINNKYKIGLVICILSISFLGFAIPTKAYNRCAYIEKEAEYLIFPWWFPGWALELNILTTRTWDSTCGHYYFSAHSEGYTAGLGTGYFRWVEYSEDIDYFYCPTCHHLIMISYEVHGRFYYYSDSSNYYDITLSIEYWADDSYDATFGPFINHLVGTWRFSEESGIQT